MSLSVIIIAKNEEEFIEGAIRSVKFADEVVVFLSPDSTDGTLSIAKERGAKVAMQPETKGLAFARWRMEAARATKGDWIFYLDADERVRLGLRKEMMAIVKSTPQMEEGSRITAWAVPRRNFYLGKEMRYGGAWPDYVERLFWKKSLKKWQGRLHERPVFAGQLGYLKNPLKHYTHRDLSSMIAKTSSWSKLEAEELYRAGHPPVVWWRFFRIMLTEAWDRGIKKQGFREGTIGMIEIIFQMFSRFIVYSRLWEMQNNRGLKVSVKK